MHLYQILLLISGACLNSGILSLTFFIDRKVKVFNHLFFKVINIPLSFFIITYVWHSNSTLACAAIISLILSPIIWPYNHYVTMFGLKPFSLKYLLTLKLITLIVGFFLSHLLSHQPNLITAYSFGLPVFHVVVLINHLTQIKKEKLELNSAVRLGKFSIYLELGIYSSMLVLIGFEYTKWFGNLILFGLIVLLIFIAISIVSKIRELSTERAIKRAEQEKYTKENLKGIKTNLELENKLSAFSGKANMVQINSSFIHESFEAANLALSSAPEQSTKILTKLSKHLRNIVQFDFPPTQELKIELKVLLDFIDVANSHSENKIIFQENHSADLFHEVPSRLLVSFANVLLSNLKATSEKFSLLLSIEEQKEELIVKALPQFEKSNFKPRMRLSSLNSFLFIQRIKVAEIKTSEAQIHLSIFLNHTK